MCLLEGGEEHSETAWRGPLGVREENQAEFSVAARVEGEGSRAGLGCGIILPPMGSGVVKVEATMVFRRGQRLAPGQGQGRVCQDQVGQQAGFAIAS